MRSRGSLAVAWFQLVGRSLAFPLPFLSPLLNSSSLPDLPPSPRPLENPHLSPSDTRP